MDFSCTDIFFHISSWHMTYIYISIWCRAPCTPPRPCSRSHRGPPAQAQVIITYLCLIFTKTCWLQVWLQSSVSMSMSTMPVIFNFFNKCILRLGVSAGVFGSILELPEEASSEHEPWVRYLCDVCVCQRTDYCDRNWSSPCSFGFLFGQNLRYSPTNL